MFDIIQAEQVALSILRGYTGQVITDDLLDAIASKLRTATGMRASVYCGTAPGVIEAEMRDCSGRAAFSLTLRPVTTAKV